MTEQEWLECVDPQKMLEFLHNHISDRKLRLFVCACCHRTLDESPYGDLASAVDVAEDVADRNAEPEAVADAEEDITWGKSEMCESLNLRAEGLEVAFRSQPITVADAAHAAERVLLGWRMNVPDISIKGEQETQCGWLRCVFGNPFQPVTIDPKRLTPKVVAVAQTIYEQRRFQDMPILADALEEAGCTDPDILNHCRSEGPHVRGCWVMDMILGKQ